MGTCRYLIVSIKKKCSNSLNKTMLLKALVELNLFLVVLLLVIQAKEQSKYGMFLTNYHYNLLKFFIYKFSTNLS